MSPSRAIRRPLLAAAALLAAPLPAALHAQPAAAVPLPLGRTLDGTLSRADPMLNERGRYQVYRLDVTPGRRYSVVMRADDFDSFLSVARQAHGLTDYLATDDDGAGNSNARLRWTPKEAGTYYLIAQALDGDGIGPFTVRLDTMPTTVITPPRTLVFDRTTSGELAESDPVISDAKPAYYDLYRVPARKGQRFAVEMRSGELDSFLSVGRMVGDSLHVEFTDDDGAGDNHARLSFTAKQDGDYIIRAQSVAVNAVGDYTVMVTERPVSATPTVALASAADVRGTLVDSNEEADDGSYYNSYRFTVRAGETVSITMRSTGFDSYLTLGQLRDGEFGSITTDDDGAGGNDARITHTFADGGEYLVRASTLSPGRTGSYTLRLDREGASVARPAPRHLPTRPATRPYPPARPSSQP